MTVANVAKEFQGVYCNDQVDPVADAQDALTDELITAQKTAVDGAASDAYTLYSFKAPWAFDVVDAVVCPGGALTANDTTNAVITLAKADGAGGAATTMATLTTNTASGNWVADTFKSFTLSATYANRRVTKGQLVTLKVTKGSTGVAVPISHYTLKVRKV